MPFIPNYADAAYSAQAEVDSVDFEIVLDGIESVGVLSGCAVTAQGTPNMTVAVASGSVKIGNSTVSVSSGNVTVTTADATYPRFDLVTVNSSGTKSVTAGTAGASPVFPSIPSSSVVLAAIYVPAAASSITSTLITDKRIVVPASEVVYSTSAPSSTSVIWVDTDATPGPLTLSTTTSTSEGAMAWDATNDQIEVGTGSSLAEFGPLGTTVGSNLGAASAGTSVQSARADHVHPTTGVVPTTRSVSISPGTGGGDLSANRTLTVQDGTTAQKGVVQLSDSTTTNASTKAATEKAVYDTKLVADAAIPKSTVTTAGDLIVATGSATVTRLQIGASGYVLTSNGTTASWAAAATESLSPFLLMGA